ncbi:Nif3-like dinuclear metal center hexameric protein [Mesoplasma lactucae]|uniref:GTP cyclohydrolase 1 type 2 homolog n=1 Tax=Mesoplasma lactucae ATCC 49193 TaxID=81460 RepID=A0A291IRN3_9MOLU|nr:Nif3-like dinuclear metal center hexameric protein [Mesoplasma lactucae]ATG97357.1 dinuclear metal center protein, YbgI family [Mesoplasma lactucae ATCC 49193]ATZ20191.1 Nif3-like dinuclear metal center hexameric protein [Mesoplasma lactucae ATCC 49193]MCL8216940.1 hypothetical protein [Mesoplasma lactucae ATCC 49193]
METAKLIKYLEKKFSPKLAADWDNVGVQLFSKTNPDLTADINKVLVCLDVTNSIVDFACENNYQMIISRHPLVFNELSQEKKTKKQLFKKLEENNIVVFSIHTNYDASPNQGLLEIIDKVMPILKNKRFGSDKEGYSIRLKNSYRLNDFISNLELIFKKANVQVNEQMLNQTDINEFDIISGSGASSLIEEKTTNTIFITGEAKWNELVYAADNNIAMVLLGHYMEEYFVPQIVDLLRNSFSDMTIDGFDIGNKILNYKEVK